MISFMASGSFANISSTIGVSMVPGHTVLGRMVRCSAGDADQAADRRAVDDGAASALTHLTQLVFHAAPNAPKIDRIHAVKLFAARIGSFHCGALHAGIVERSIQSSEGGDGLLNHRCHLTLVRYVAADGECLVARRD